MIRTCCLRFAYASARCRESISRVGTLLPGDFLHVLPVVGHVLYFQENRSVEAGLTGDVDFGSISHDRVMRIHSLVDRVRKLDDLFYIRWTVTALTLIGLAVYHFIPTFIALGILYADIQWLHSLPDVAVVPSSNFLAFR